MPTGVSSAPHTPACLLHNTREGKERTESVGLCILFYLYLVQGFIFKVSPFNFICSRLKFPLVCKGCTLAFKGLYLFLCVLFLFFKKSLFALLPEVEELQGCWYSLCTWFSFFKHSNALCNVKKGLPFIFQSND